MNRLKLLLILAMFTVGCTKATNENSDRFKELVLAEQFDATGKLKKKIVTGRIPGEDVYLVITEYDSIGRVMEKYGAEPYGTKFKTRFHYDHKGRVIEEIDYDFKSNNNQYGQFENYKYDELYEISDTSVDFTGRVYFRSVFKYDNTGHVNEKIFFNDFDSLLGKEYFKEFSDTTYAVEMEGR